MQTLISNVFFLLAIGIMLEECYSQRNQEWVTILLYCLAATRDLKSGAKTG